MRISDWSSDVCSSDLRQGFALSRTLHNYGKILVDKRFIPFALALCIAQAGFFAYIAGSASVFISEYALSLTQFSLLFGANAFGLIFAAIFNTRLHHRVGPLNAYRILNTDSFILFGSAKGWEKIWKS